MDFPVKETIVRFGLKRFAGAIELPISTIFRWKEEDRIPGGEKSKRVREILFKAAAEKLAADDARKTRKRRSA